MNRLAPDGSVIIINRADSTLLDGRFYVFSVDNGAATFKTYRRDPERLQPFSTNPDHMSIPVTGDTDLYVFWPGAEGNSGCLTHDQQRMRTGSQ